MTTPLPDLRSSYELNRMPFTRELKVSERFKLDEHEKVIARMQHAVQNRMSCALIAPAGTGKSVILRALKDVLPEARYRVRYLHVTNLSARDFCRELCAAIGCPSAGYYGALVKRLREHWSQQLNTDSVRPVILLDEAHDMRPEVLSILRVLTNFSMDSRLVVSIVLAGQLPLRALISRQKLEAVRGRMAYYGSLRLLSRTESRDYVRYRCQLAGAGDSLFDEQAHDALFEAAQGNMRAIDTLARAALLEAAADSAKLVSTHHVIAARNLITP